MITPASIKEKLKNIATKHNKTLQELLISYALERTIYRIANSKYLNNFTLKRLSKNYQIAKIQTNGDW